MTNKHYKYNKVHNIIIYGTKGDLDSYRGKYVDSSVASHHHIIDQAQMIDLTYIKYIKLYDDKMLILINRLMKKKD